ncbi:hypothetical protein [Parapedobacter sp. DT-150]|uniref:hypothetical protein n=1 Tax=Parapedobacter sp. DT-150 TaxID=3396162 RepID=UPI003F1DB5A3
MAKRKIEGQAGVMNDPSLGTDDELRIARKMLVALKYHVRTQYLLSSRRAKQRAVIWIAVLATVLTVIAAVLYAGR